jgi:uncharacterized protein (DUF169 family)
LLNSIFKYFVEQRYEFIKWIEIGKEIYELLRLRTPPVGVVFSEKDEVPEDAFVPSKYGVQIAVCQAIAFARFTGRTVAMKYEDFACPPSIIFYGLAKGDLKEILVEAGWIKDAECKVDEDSLPKGKYKTFIFGDLTRMKMEPQAILVFGKPAQIGRLIQARTYYGGKVRAELISKAASCFEALNPAMNGDVAISIPGAGDRVFSSIGEDEMIFSMPYGWLEKIVEGLKNAGKGANISYPVTPFVLFTPRFPKSYKEAQQKFEKI